MNTLLASVLGALLGILIGVPMIIRYGDDITNFLSRSTWLVRAELWLRKTFAK